MGSAPNSSKNTSSNTNQPSPYAGYIATPEVVGDPSWCLDSGATHHVTNDASQL